MSLIKLTESDSNKLSDLRQAKQTWSKRLLSGAGPTAFTARGTAAPAAPQQNGFLAVSSGWGG